MTGPSHVSPPRVLAISSGGGHWVQLLRLAPAFEGAEVHYACTDADAAGDVSAAPFYSYPDANKSQPIKLAITAIRIACIIVRVRPDVIVSTGAAGGGLAVMMGRWLGIRSLFVDSIANAKELSVSAKLALRAADAVFTQWPKVAAQTPAVFRGSVL